MNLQTVWNATTKVALVQTAGTAVPTGSVKLGEFVHEDNNDKLGKPLADNHVIFHHVRDALYKIGQLDMQIVRIAVVPGLNIPL